MADAEVEFEDDDDGEAADRQLIGLYLRFGVPVDSLAYSDEFEQLYNEFHLSGDTRTKGEVYRRLLMLRKSGRLPRLDTRHESDRNAEPQ